MKWFLVFVTVVQHLEQIQAVINRVILLTQVLAASVCTLMIMFGAFEWKLSGGDPDKIRNGKRKIMYAALGYILVLLAPYLTRIFEWVATGK